MLDHYIAISPLARMTSSPVNSQDQWTDLQGGINPGQIYAISEYRMSQPGLERCIVVPYICLGVSILGNLRYKIAPGQQTIVPDSTPSNTLAPAELWQSYLPTTASHNQQSVLHNHKTTIHDARPHNFLSHFPPSPHLPRHHPLGRPLQHLFYCGRPKHLVLEQPSRSLPVLYPRTLHRLQLHLPLPILQKPGRHSLQTRRTIHP